MVCGMVMAVAQVSVVGPLIGRVGEMFTVAIGFSLLGTSHALLMASRKVELILVFVAIFAFGMACINPSLASLISKRAGKRPGSALGLQISFNSLGQSIGPLAGGLLLAWYTHLPYYLTAILLIANRNYCFHPLLPAF